MEKESLIQLLEQAKFDDFIIQEIKKIPLNLDPAFNLYLNQDLKDYKPEKLLKESLESIPAMIAAYQKRSIPKTYFLASFQDLNYRLKKYYKEHSQLGLDPKDQKWLGLLFRAEIFSIGSFRFQYFPMDFQEIERQGRDYLELTDQIKQTYPSQSPMINVHIPNQADLRPETVAKNFQEASRFFNQYFKEFKAEYFICRTWLLHPGLQKILKPKSNILNFASYFQLIGQSNNYDQALDRIYKTHDLDKIKKLDKKSHLEKVAHQELENLGVACGVIAIKKLSEQI